MSDKKEVVERFNKSRNRIDTIHLSQIKLSPEKYSHRDNIDDSEIDELKVSLAQEGQETPMTVIPVGGETVTVGDEKLDVFELIGGYRRYTAFKRAVKENVEGFDDDMPVTVTILERGADQSEESFRKDVLVRSMSENSNRKGHSPVEIVKRVKQLQDGGVDASRGMVSVGLKKTQYDRNLLIVERKWASDAVVNGIVTPTNMSSLLEKAKKVQNDKDRKKPEKDQFEILKRGMANWIAWAEDQLQQENDRRAARNQQELEGTQALLKRFIKSSDLKRWRRCLDDGIDFDTTSEAGGNGATFKYMITTGTEKLALEIPKLELKAQDLSVEKLETIKGALMDGLRKVAALLVDQRRKTPPTEDEIAAELAFNPNEGRPPKDEAPTPEPPETTTVPDAVGDDEEVEDEADPSETEE